jgi:adenylate kinase
LVQSAHTIGSTSRPESFVCALVGRPGAGKGTQAAVACSQLALSHVSTGDLARAVPIDHRHHRELSAHLSSGRLLPDDMVFELVVEHLAQLGSARGVLLDGFPRNLSQADTLHGLLPVDVVVHLDVSEAAARRRLLLRNRSDDGPEAAAARLRTFDEQTRPMLEWYRSKGKLRNVDGDRLPELVAADVLATLTER